MQRGTKLLAAPVYNFTVRSNIPAIPPLNTETDTTAVGKGPYFYRIELEP